MEKSEGTEWVLHVITPNDLSSVHELAVAANANTGLWERVMLVRAPDDPNYVGIMSLKLAKLTRS